MSVTKKAWYVQINYEKGNSVSQVVRAANLVPFIRENDIKCTSGRCRVNAYVIHYMLANSPIINVGKVESITVKETEVDA